MLGIVKPSRRGNRVSLINPKGRAFKALGRRQPALAMGRHRRAPAS